MSFPLAMSVAGHVICLALLVWLLPTSLPPASEPLTTSGIEVTFEPNLPQPEQPQLPAAAAPTEAPPSEPETPPAEAQPLPPTSPEPVAASEPPPPPPAPEPPPEAPAPVVETPPPEAPAPVVEAPPPPKPAVPPPKHAQRRREKAQPKLATAPAELSPAAIARPQTAYVPAPAPAPPAEVSPGYRALLSAWLESHKRYPDSSRQRGEEGRAVLRFAVERSGRVLDFAVAQSTGYPDLDASLEQMMRGAVLPPFPPGMTQPRIDVAVTIRFSLAR